jgi:preprotein translocase subunit SecG
MWKNNHTKVLAVLFLILGVTLGAAEQTPANKESAPENRTD